MGLCCSRQMGLCCSRQRSLENENNEIIIQNKNEIVENHSERENINEISYENDIREQDCTNELIEVTECKPCYRNIEKYEIFEETEIKSDKNKSDKNKSDKNKSDKNKSDKNKSDNNKSGENISDKNKSDKNKSGENISDKNKSVENISVENRPAQYYSEMTKSKLRESRDSFFASCNEAKPNQYQISENNKRNISSRVEKKKNLIVETVDDTTSRRTEINKASNDILKEILDIVLSEIILREAEKKMVIEFSQDMVKNVLLNAVHYVSVEKLAIEVFDELFIELIIGIVLSVWKPLGFANPKGYCYLNSVVQVLGSCEGFKKDIYEHNLNTNDKSKDSIFVEGLFDLIKAITEYNKENLKKSLNIVQQNITESSFGDDVYKCFMNLLTRVSNVIKTNIERPTDHFTSLPITLSEKAKNTFARFKNRNPGFVFDNFYGQLTFQTVCKICNHLCNESFQMIKSLPLPVPENSNSSETLNSCIDLFFKDSDVEVDEPMKCKCESDSTMSLKSISKLTHGPKYLFIYLNRGSYTDDGVKNDTHVTCDDLTVHIKALENQSIKYKLISVIDHVGDSAYGHYYCKCSFETEDWWLLNDSQVSLLKNKREIVTKNTIVFLFKIIS